MVLAGGRPRLVGAHGDLAASIGVIAGVAVGSLLVRMSISNTRTSKDDQLPLSQVGRGELKVLLSSQPVDLFYFGITCRNRESVKGSVSHIT